MSLAAIVQALADAGCTAVQIAAAVAAHETEADQKAAATRAKAAARKARWRALNVRDCPRDDAGQDGTDGDSAGHTLPPKEKSPTPPKEITPYPSSLRSVSFSAREAVDQFWSAYPHKVGKPTAERAFDQQFRRLNCLTAPILDGLARYCREKPSDRAWMNPATFLNQRRYEDEPGQPPARAGPGPRIDGLKTLSRKLGDIIDGSAAHHTVDQDQARAADAGTASLFGGPDERGRANGVGRIVDVEPVGPYTRLAARS